MTKRAKLKAALAAIVDAMVPEEKPTPNPTPAVAPAPSHRAHIKPDQTMCCQRHDEEFERHVRAYAESSPFIIPLAWAIGRHADPPPPPPAWKPQDPDPQFLDELRRRAARWFGRR